LRPRLLSHNVAATVEVAAVDLASFDQLCAGMAVQQ
jgi:hypothetical protein